MDEAALIRAFLADRDIPCPSCSYNLRGAGQGQCPECGLRLGLTLTRAAISANPYPPDIEAARVVEYLRRRDVKCPRCRRGLRGVSTPECPGCQLRLTVWALRPQGLDLPGGRFSGARFVAGFLVVLLLLLLAVFGLMSFLM